VNKPGENGSGTTPARARRFEMRTLLKYRRPDASWHDAVTVNVSRSGLLFETSEDLVPGTPLELTIHFANLLHATAVVVRNAREEEKSLVGARFDALCFFESGLVPPKDS